MDYHIEITIYSMINEMHVAQQAISSDLLRSYSVLQTVYYLLHIRMTNEWMTSNIYSVHNFST